MAENVGFVVFFFFKTEALSVALFLGLKPQVTILSRKENEQISVSSMGLKITNEKILFCLLKNSSLETQCGVNFFTGDIVLK